MKKKCLLLFAVAVVVVFTSKRFERVYHAYRGVFDEIARQQQISDDVSNRPNEKYSYVSRSQRVLEEFEVKNYNNFFQVDPFGVSSNSVSAFICNLGSKSSLMASLYCWLKGRGSDVDKEASLKCLRCLYFFEKEEVGWGSNIRHKATTIFLMDMLNKEYNNERLDALKKASLNMMQNGVTLK